MVRPLVLSLHHPYPVDHCSPWEEDKCLDGSEGPCHVHHRGSDREQGWDRGSSHKEVQTWDIR